jgi:hypothetical protein
MAESSLYAGERAGGRIFRIGRLGFDQGSADLEEDVYTGVYRTERVQPAGPGSLVMFRRVAVHLMTSGNYTFSLKVWVDNERTELATGTEQTFTVTGVGGALREVTKEVAIEAEGSHIQVEISVDSDDVTGLFLVESVSARGRVIRESASRTGETS